MAVAKSRHLSFRTALGDIGESKDRHELWRSVLMKSMTTRVLASLLAVSLGLVVSRDAAACEMRNCDNTKNGPGDCEQAQAAYRACEAAEQAKADSRQAEKEREQLEKNHRAELDAIRKLDEVQKRARMSAPTGGGSTAVPAR